MEIVFHPQAVPCLAHQYGLQDWFSRLKMKIFHPVSFMCFVRYFNSSNRLLEKKSFFVVKSFKDIFILTYTTENYIILTSDCDISQPVLI